MDMMGKGELIMCQRIAVLLGVVGLLSAASMSVVPAASAEEPTAGYLYGTVTTKSGNEYTGVLRWGSEEAFWDDLFHSAKDELPYAEFGEPVEQPREDEKWWETLFRKVEITFGDEGQSRIFMARFGDIRSIRVTGGDSADVTMKNGTIYSVSGYANDVGGTVTVRDPALGDVELGWKQIDTIEFKPTPAEVEPAGTRLYGTVVTDAGSFDGFIQWDEQECLSVDRLDGKSEDGSMSVAMGSIRTIERRTEKSCRVVLSDGRELVLSGTNDVNDDNRGILIEDPRFGRVEVSWDEFERVEFRDPPSSGRGFDDYPPPVPLRGTVTDRDGNRRTGKIVFDLDESESWELLNGCADDLEYNIPFETVVSIEPTRSATVVTLRGGEELRLEDGQDVSARNAGVVVVSAANDEHYVRWRDVDRIDLEW
jgi:hypothetical protein